VSRARLILIALVLALAVPGGVLLAYQPAMQDVAAMAPFAPDLLGLGRPRRFLVLAQNPAELRPTGGYIGTVGIVTISGGRVLEHSFDDVFHYDLQPNLPYVQPPDPAGHHLLGDNSWQLADANWAADYPTSAQKALQLYTLESGDSNIDGVIAINTFAVDTLLQAVGPVTVPDYDVTVGPGDVTMTALRLTRGASTQTSDRKAFLGSLADLILQKVQDSGPSEWPKLLDAFNQLKTDRDLLVWLADPSAERSLAATPMGGALDEAPGDYLYVVEANVAPTSKYNLAVDRTDQLKVTLASNGDAQSSLNLAWQNNAGTTGQPYDSLREFSTNKSGFYAAYVRALMPPTSQLISAQGNAADPIDAAEYQGTESGHAMAGNYLLMLPGPSTLTYEWATPAVATQAPDGTWTYRLTVQKQPGLRPMPLSVTLSLPPGAQVGKVFGGAEQSDGIVTLDSTSVSDVDLEVTYRIRE